MARVEALLNSNRNGNRRPPRGKGKGRGTSRMHARSTSSGENRQRPTLGKGGGRNVRSAGAGGKGGTSVLVDAAALQAHFTRNLNLSLALPRARVSQRDREPAPQRGWLCETCTLMNKEGSPVCEACGSAYIDPERRVALSLAQKRGLVKAPPPKLTKGEWHEAIIKSETRGDSAEPCSICLAPFGLQEQVILSCTHMFHKDCLASFERFLRVDQRTCPLCRKKNYQKKLTDAGARVYRLVSCTKIQSVMRRVLMRKAFQVALRAHYASGQGDQRMRYNFFADRIGNVSDQVMRNMQTREDSIDSLLAEFDRFHRLQPSSICTYRSWGAVGRRTWRAHQSCPRGAGWIHWIH
jgi:hypothetical protein